MVYYNIRIPSPLTRWGAVCGQLFYPFFLGFCYLVRCPYVILWILLKVKNLYFYESFRLYKLETLVFFRLLGILKPKLSGGVL